MQDHLVINLGAFFEQKMNLQFVADLLAANLPHQYRCCLIYSRIIGGGGSVLGGGGSVIVGITGQNCIADEPLSVVDG